ncbi:MAG: CHC2 zinc finger domain-containing protein [Actinomycetota bacterium]|nr:CHC2 zinc finger domain-containing protein [Actinomycetota bacterium]
MELSRHTIPQQSGDEHGQNGRPNGFKRLLEAVKAQVPVERLAGDIGAELRQNGHGLRGRCPLHGGESNDAFAVYPEQGRFHCFRCSDGGDVLDLFEKARGYFDRTAALMDLAGEYGVEAPPRSDRWHAWQAEKGRRHDGLREIRTRLYQRRLLRMYADDLARIEDPDDREQEARRLYDDLYYFARTCAEWRADR